MHIFFGFLFFFCFSLQDCFSFDSVYFGFSIPDKIKGEAKVITKKPPREVVHFEDGVKSNLVKSEVKKFLKEIKNIEFHYQQLTVEPGNHIMIGKGEFKIIKPNYISYKYIGTENDDSNYTIMKEKDDGTIYDHKTGQKTAIERKNGIEDIFLKSDKEIDSLLIEIGFIKNQIISCFFSVDNEKFCLIFDRIEQDPAQNNLNNKEPKTQNTNDKVTDEKNPSLSRQDEVQNAILDENKKTFLNLTGVLIHSSMIHSEIKVTNVKIKDRDNDTQEIIVDKKLRDE